MRKMNGKKWSTCSSSMFEMCNYHLYAAREKERWKLVYTTSCGLIGERALRLVAPSGHV